jgi:hypothetical protein
MYLLVLAPSAVNCGLEPRSGLISVFFKYIRASCDKYAKLEMETEQYLQLCQALKANQK